MAQGPGGADEPLPQTRCSAVRWPSCVSARRAQCRASCSRASAPSRPGVCNRTGRAFPSLKASFQNPRRRPPGRGWGAGSRGKERELPSRNQSKGFSARPLNPGSAPPSAPGLDIDGLYRISGNLATIQKLRYKVDHGEARPLALPQACRRLKERADLFFLPPLPPRPPAADERLDLEDGHWEDVHVITGALKLFFRELPEPLFPFSHFRQFLAAISECLGEVERIGYGGAGLPHARSCGDQASPPNTEVSPVCFPPLLPLTRPLLRATGSGQAFPLCAGPGALAARP